MHWWLSGSIDLSHHNKQQARPGRARSWTCTRPTSRSRWVAGWLMVDICICSFPRSIDRPRTRPTNFGQSITRSIYPKHQKLQMAASLGEVRALLRTQAQGRKELLKYCKKDLDAALNVRLIYPYIHIYMRMCRVNMRMCICIHPFTQRAPSKNTHTHNPHRTRSASSPRCSPRRCTSWCWMCWKNSSTTTWSTRYVGLRVGAW